MLRNTVLIVAALAVAMIVMPAAAQSAAQPVQQASASGGDGFTVQDWRIDSPADAAEWSDETPGIQSAMAAHSWVAPHGEPPSLMLAGGLDDDPFLLDGRFHNGQMYTDRFGANNGDTTDKWAKKALRLSNGDVVTIALVPKDGATSNPAYGVGWNIGMVRYNAAGVKQKWTNAAESLTDSTRSYYVFPNKDEYNSNGSYTNIYDAKEHDGWIYVLAQRYRGASDKTYDVRVLRFQLSSSRWAWSNVFGSASVSEWGVGMRFYTDGGFDKLTVAVGRRISSVPDINQTWMAGYIVGDAGALATDSSFGTNGIRNVTPAGCDTCKPVTMAGSTMEAGATYIAGNYYAYNSTNQNGYVTKLDKTGASNPEFGGFPSEPGFQDVYFKYTPVEQATDDVRDIVVGTNTSGGMEYERIYILATVENSCGTTSAGVWKLTSVGGPDPTFGPAGKGGQLLFGGGENYAPCLDTSSITPYAMALNGNRLAIVGYSTVYSEFAPPGYADRVGGPSFNVMDKDIGYLSDSRVLRPTGVDIGPNGGDGASTFYSVVPSDADSFYAVGLAKDAANNHRNVPMTARVRADRIFGNGLEYAYLHAPWP